MTFHKAKEESKWKQWKEQEERILRKSGVSEEVIQRLRELDWQRRKPMIPWKPIFSPSLCRICRRNYARDLGEPSGQKPIPAWCLF